MLPDDNVDVTVPLQPVVRGVAVAIGDDAASLTGKCVETMVIVATSPTVATAAFSIDVMMACQMVLLPHTSINAGPSGGDVNRRCRQLGHAVGRRVPS